MNSVRELIDKSAELIDKGWDLLGNANMSHYPVILVYVGESVHFNRQYILKTLKNNWKNGSYIEQILVPIDYDGTDAVLLENFEQDGNETEVTGSLSKVIDVCIRQRLLKSMEGVFADKRRIFVEYIAACENLGDFDSIKELIKPVETINGIEVWKNLYLMIDQSITECDENARKIVNCMNKASEAVFSEDGFRQIYILSNYLTSGTILSDNEIKENYRAISDILLLKNNYNINTGRKSADFELLNQRGSVRTIAYKLVEKPCREIAIATYMGLIAEMVGVSINDKLYSAFNTSEFTFFEDYFINNIEHRMPDARAMEYMAWIPEELERLKKVPAVTQEMLDRATMGQWSAFFDTYYKEILNDETDIEGFKDKFRRYLKGKFNYREMRECFKKEETQNVVERGNISAAAGGRDLFMKSALYGKEYAHKLYYERYVGPIFRNMLDHLYEKADDFDHMIQSIKNYLPRALVIINSRLYASIGEYYGKIIRNYIGDHREEFNLLMDVDLTREEFYEAVFKFFGNMVNQIDIYTLNFEEELSSRLEGMGSDFAKRNQIIEESLSRNIETSRRLNVSMDANCRPVYQTYLGNPRADFVKRLMGEDGNNVYDLEKSDCIENLVIYQMNSLNDIFGG